MNAGIDFESKILVKERAPDLLRDWLARPKYQPEIIVMSGVTDCYQPAEREYRLTSRPQARLRAITQLPEAGIPATVMVAPIIPGLNDSEVPGILKAASKAGALGANYIVLRLPLNVRPVFGEWLARTQPLHQDRVLSRIRSSRDGRLTDSQYGRRMRGEGEMAAQFGQTFEVFAKKYGLDRKLPPLDFSQFRAPRTSAGQMNLF